MLLARRILARPQLILKGIKDPRLSTVVLNKIVHQHQKGKHYNRDGVDIFEERDWDNLIVLDACRYDAYASLTPFDGDLEKVESRGTSSDQWMYGNFNGRTQHDIVYVSGNKWYLALQENSEFENELHYYHDVERDVFHEYVPSPENTTEAALEFAEKYPKKRLIVHYMQPHKPYLGKHREAFEFPADEDINLRTAVERHAIDRETLVEAYRDNLRIVLEHVEELVDELDGKTAVTSDHGEMLGERMWPIPVRWYGHPSRMYIDVLLDVPWQVVSEGPRRDIVPEPPQPTSDYDFDEVEENLRKLGYKPEAVADN